MQDYIPRVIDINEEISEVTVKQFDNNSRFLHVQILDKDADDGWFDLTECSAVLYIQPEGDTGSNVAYISGEASSDENGNYVTFLIPNGVTQNIGRYECEIWIYQGDDENRPVISTKKFYTTVEKSIRNTSAIEASSSFSALDEALSTVTNISVSFDRVDQRINGKADATPSGSAVSAAKLDDDDVGSGTRPCYFEDGVPVPCTYSLNKTVPSNAIFSYSPATTSANGLMSSADKLKLNGINAGTGVILRNGNSGAVDLFNSSTGNELDLGNDVNFDVNFSDYSAVDIRYLQYSTGSVDCYATLRAIRVNESYGNIPVMKYSLSSNTISTSICVITLTGSKIQVVDAGRISQLYISAVVGYK